MAAAATNIILDPKFSSAPINATRLADPATAGSWAITSPNASAGAAALSTLALMPSALVPLYVNAGEQYYLTVNASLSGGAASAGIQFAFDTGSDLGPVQALSVGANVIAQLITIPPGVTSAYVRLIVTGSSGTVTFSGPTCYITAGSNQLQSGSVTNSAIALGAVTANSIAAAAVTANAIQANSIDASKIVANTITAAQIAAGTITATQIAANTITATQLAAGIVYATIVDGTTITGAQIVADGTTGNFLVYAGTPAAGNLFFAVSPSSGTDGFGNPYNQGITFIGIAGLTNTLSILDTSGNKLAGIDSTGNVTGLVMNAATDVQVGGTSIPAQIASAPIGLVNYGYVGTPFPSSVIAGGTEIALFELDQAVVAGRVYEFTMNPTVINIGGSVAPTIVHLYLRYTSDGSTPSTSSTLATECALTVANPSGAGAGHDMSIGPLSCPFFAAASGTYRFLVTGIATTSANFQFKSDPYVRCTVADLGSASVGANNLVVLGSGTSGGNSAQNYTETFGPGSTNSYYSNGPTLRDNDGTMYHGAYSGESPNYQYSYIGWGSGSLGTANLATLLGGGYTINWATFRLTNLHSWYDSGMNVGVHTSTSLGSTTWSAILNTTSGWFISEGNTFAFSVNSSMWTSMFAASTYTVLAPYSGALTNLSWYGYFYGYGSDASSVPLITVNYSH